MKMIFTFAVVSFAVSAAAETVMPVCDGWRFHRGDVVGAEAIGFDDAKWTAVAAGALRPPAVPLVSVEPHFSVWSAADRLYDKDTTHWGGVAQPLLILLDADGTVYRLCGRGNDETFELPVLQQTRSTSSVDRIEYIGCCRMM